MSVERDVSVFWSPLGDECALLDCYASNESRVLVVDVAAGKLFLEINRANLSDRMHTVPETRDYSHFALSHFKWVSPTEFAVHVFMYDPLTNSVKRSYRGVLRFELSRNRS